LFLAIFLRFCSSTFSQCNEYKQLHSHEKVELLPSQWEALTRIFLQVGVATKYHGMIDIEFIIAGEENNPHAEPGSVWMLESNPRFSGDIHTTLSNPGFLDKYFDIVFDRADTKEICNYSLGVDMKAEIGNWYPMHFYAQNPFHIISIRHWRVHNFHRYRPDSMGDATKNSSAGTKEGEEEGTQK